MALHHSDHVPFGIGELADHETFHHLVGPHHARASELPGPGERRLGVGHLHVEGHVPLVALRARAHAPAYSGAVRVGVPLALDSPVIHRVVRVDLPPEELSVIALEPLPIFANDFEVNHWLSHAVTLVFRHRMGPTEQNFQKLVSQLDYPMFIATVATGEARAGCLIGFATQCSIHPPRFLAGVSDKNHTHRVAQGAAAMGVHLVPEDATELAELFGGETGDELDKFERCSWRPGP